jgi:hypothetical protein
LGSNGRIPPLPRGYSQALSSVIKAMLNLNVSKPDAVCSTTNNIDALNSHRCDLQRLNYCSTSGSNSLTKFSRLKSSKYSVYSLGKSIDIFAGWTV